MRQRAPAGQLGRVLVVEDDAGVAALECQVLQRAGYAVEVATSQASALGQLGAREYTAVVLDFQLADGNTWPVLEAAQACRPPVPVVLVTGQGDEQVAAEAHRRGASDYVVKSGPFARILADAVARAQAAAETQWRVAALANVWQAAADAIVSVALDGQISTWNPAAARLFGRPEALAVRQPLTTFITFAQCDLAAVLTAASSCTGTGVCSSHCAEPTCMLQRLGPQAATCLAPNGSQIELVVTIALVRDARGVPAEVALIARDVTAQKELERQLRLKVRQLAIAQHARDSAARAAETLQHRYQELFDRSQLAIFLVGPDLGVLEVNPAATALLRRDRAQVVGSAFADFLVADQRAGTVVRLRETLAGVDALPITATATAQRGDGTTSVLEVTISRVDLAAGVALLVMAADNSARAAAQAALKASEIRYATLLANIPDLVWRTTLDGLTLFVSPVVERLLGYSAEEVYANGTAIWPGRVHADDVDSVRAGFAELAAGRPLDCKFRIWHRDGHVVWLHGRGVRVQEPDGSYVAEGVATDITETTRLQAQFLQAQRLEAVGQLATGIAHDFNNLLSAILACSTFIAEDLPTDHPCRADALEIKAAAESSARLTRQLLAFSRKQSLSPALVDASEVLAGMERLLRRTVSADIAVHTNLPSGLPRVLVDVGQLEQVILNLVVNARDAMPTGGHLHLATAIAGAAELAGLDLAPGQYLCIRVRDTGTGMDAATRARIFEPFFTTKELGKGTGLGLSTCFGIVQQSGGAIEVDSEPGLGTTFRTYLPCAQQPPVQAVEAPGKGTPRQLGALRALVVEDNPAVLRTVSRALRDAGHDVATATNLAEASDVLLACTGSLDLVISDMVMAGGSGLQVIAALRAVQPGLPAILMSGYSDHPLTSPDALPDGVVFLHKPFEPETLRRSIRTLLAG